MINEPDFERQVFRSLLSQKQFLIEFHSILDHIRNPVLLKMLVDRVKKVIKDKKQGSQ